MISHKRVLSHWYQLFRNLCKGTVHLKYLPQLTKADTVYTEQHLNVFYCSVRSGDIFAFNKLHATDFNEALAKSLVKEMTVYFEYLEKQGLIFTTFDLNDKHDTLLYDIDPDIQCFNDQISGSLHSCDYYEDHI